MRIIFLDIDGVLNGYNLRVHLTFNFLKFIFPKRWRYYFNIFGVHIMKVFILWIICKLTGAKIVMSSSWRFSYWKTSVNEMHNDIKKLYNLLKFFNINVIDVTKAKSTTRGEQIQDWFTDNKKYKIESFIIIDDEMFDISPYFPKNRLLSTKAEDNRLFKFKCCGCYDGAGIKFKHVIPAIKILKTPIENEKE